MVNEFDIAIKTDTSKDEPVAMARLLKKLRDRCEHCREPTCWTLKDPNDDGQIYLKKDFFGTRSHRGRPATIRQILFRLAYNIAPPVGQPLRNICGTPGCVNPAHLVTRTWRPTYGQVTKMVAKEWLTREQAAEWYKE